MPEIWGLVTLSHVFPLPPFLLLLYLISFLEKSSPWNFQTLPLPRRRSSVATTTSVALTTFFFYFPDLHARRTAIGRRNPWNSELGLARSPPKRSPTPTRITKLESGTQKTPSASSTTLEKSPTVRKPVSAGCPPPNSRSSRQNGWDRPIFLTRTVTATNDHCSPRKSCTYAR